MRKLIVCIMIVGIALPAAAQPGCNGTPTPTPDPDGGGIYIQPACPVPTATLTPEFAPVLGNEGGGEVGSDDTNPVLEGEERGYNPEGDTYIFNLPSFPSIATVTPFGTSVSGGAVGTATPNTTPAGQIIGDAAGLSGTLDAVDYSATPFTNIDGSEFSYEATIDDLYLRILEFFSYMKGLNPAQLGKIGEVISFSFLIFVFVMVVKLTRLAIPMFVKLVAWIIRIVKLIFEFIQSLFASLPGF